MRTMYELCEGKVWRAVEAMIKGLHTQSQRDDFKINMSTFGESNVICFGCAATCTIQQLTGINLTVDTISKEKHSIALQVNTMDLFIFENTIECLRKGYLGPLFDYFKKDRRLVSFRNLPVLHTCNWQTHIKEYTTLLIALKEFDI